ncbi:MAG: hypothetical protein P1V97_23815 [Planctomycetota bacterium]|nr:hypothetical protein [Planctomycetota bacterium]
MLRRNSKLILASLSLCLTLACTEKSTPPNPGRSATVDDFPNENILRIDGVDPQEGASPFSYRYRVRYQGPKEVFQIFVQVREEGKLVLLGSEGEKVLTDLPGKSLKDIGSLNLFVDGFYIDKKRMDTTFTMNCFPPKTGTETWKWALSCQGKISQISTDDQFAKDGPELAALKGAPEWLDYCTVSGDDANNIILGAVLFGADPELKNKDFIDRINGAKKAYLFGVRLEDK